MDKEKPKKKKRGKIIPVTPADVPSPEAANATQEPVTVPEETRGQGDSPAQEPAVEESSVNPSGRVVVEHLSETAELPDPERFAKLKADAEAILRRIS